MGQGQTRRMGAEDGPGRDQEDRPRTDQEDRPRTDQEDRQRRGQEDKPRRGQEDGPGMHQEGPLVGRTMVGAWHKLEGIMSGTREEP
jgi:hypothetical protein